MKYKLTRSRKEGCDCYTCNKSITKVEYAYTSTKRKYCGSCGKMENDYSNVGMNRPHL